MTVPASFKTAGWALWFMALGAAAVFCVQRQWVFLSALLVLLAVAGMAALFRLQQKLEHCRPRPADFLRPVRA